MLIQTMRGSRRTTRYKNAPKRTSAFILLSRRIFKVFVKASERTEISYEDARNAGGEGHGP